MSSDIKEYLDPGKKNLILIYILFLVGVCISIPLLLIPAVVLAFSNQNNSEEPWTSHYIFVLRTFFFGLLGSIIASAMMISLLLSFLGILLYIAIFVWLVVRSILSLKYLLNDLPHPKPRSLGI